MFEENDDRMMEFVGWIRNGFSHSLSINENEMVIEPSKLWTRFSTKF